MIGYIKKEYLAYFRRTWGISYIISFGMAIPLLLFLPNEYSLYVILTLVMPVNCSIGNTLKEIDTESMGCRYSMTLPYSWKDVVTGRFLVACVDWIVECTWGFLMMLIHYFLIGSFSFEHYLGIWAVGAALGCFMASFNTFTGFLAGITVASILYLLTLVVMVILYILVFFTDISFVSMLTMNPTAMMIGLCIAVIFLSFGFYRLSLWKMKRSRNRK